MTSPSQDEIVSRTRLLSAVTSSLKEEVFVTWRIKNFSAEAAVATSKGNKSLGVSFFVGGKDGCDAGQGASNFSGMPRVSLVCTLDRVGMQIYLTLSLGNPEKAKADLENSYADTLKERWTFFEPEIINSKGEKLTWYGKKEPKKLAMGGWEGQYFDLRHLRDWDENASLTFNLKVTTYDVASEVLTAESKAYDVTGLEGKYRKGVLTDVESLLGDKKTSDVRISVVYGEKDVEDFFCHKAILSARSPVFRAMFDKDGMIEGREGLVKIPDVSTEVMKQFLAFVYSGRLTETTKNSGVNCEPIWVKMLPHLAYLADKYDVGDLKDFCDVNLVHAVTKDNALDIYNLAKRHGLLKAVAKLRNHFAQNIDLLLEPTPK